MIGYMEGKNETSHHLNVGIKLFTYFDLSLNVVFY